MKEYFDNLLPTHIASTISLENIQLIKSNLVDDSYTNQTKYKLGNGLELRVILETIRNRRVFKLLKAAAHFLAPFVGTI